MATAYLSLGSNQDAAAHLRRAVAELRQRFGAVQVSPVYRTAAVGFAGADFLNCAAILATDLAPAELCAWLHALEDAHGRRRDQPRFSARPLDIDLVFYDDLVLSGAGGPRIPRPELQHAFVLQPLADIAPSYREPRSGLSLAALWAQHDDHPGPVAIDLDLGRP